MRRFRLPIASLILSLGAGLVAVLRHRGRVYKGRCRWCNYDQSATPKGQPCPECGRAHRPLR